MPQATSKVWHHASVGKYGKQRTFQAGGEDGWHPIELGSGRQGQHILLEVSHCRVTHKLEQTGLQTTAQLKMSDLRVSQKNITISLAGGALHRHVDAAAG